MSPDSQTRALLERFHDGDAAALQELLVRDLPWVRAYVERRLGAALRRQGDIDDYVQEAMVQALQYGPRFVVDDHDRFRALLARITENVLRDQAARLRTEKRDPAREQPFPSESRLYLDPPVRSVTRPSVAVQRAQERAWIALAIELLPAADRTLVRRREWEGRSFPEIAEELGIHEDAARMRFARLLPRLAQTLDQLRRGAVGVVIRDAEAGDHERPPPTEPPAAV